MRPTNKVNQLHNKTNLDVLHSTHTAWHN